VIFVTVGSAEPFDRLLRSLPRPESEEIVAQTGPSVTALPGVRCVPFMGFEEIASTMGQARVVVAHAGVGTVLSAFNAGKKPVLVPRRREFGEAVDDHQVELAHRLAGCGLAHVVDDPAELLEILADLDGSLQRDAGAGENRLTADIGAFLEATLARRQH
jgi:UDP-N-acetylglucosamine transferase subunit ALG13